MKRGDTAVFIILWRFPVAEMSDSTPRDTTRNVGVSLHVILWVQVRPFREFFLAKTGVRPLRSLLRYNYDDDDEEED